MAGNILALAAITVYVVSLSGFTDSWKRALWRIFRKGLPYADFRLRPFDCPLCLTWWSGLGMLAFGNALTWENVLLVAAASYLTPVIEYALEVARDALTMIIRYADITINGDFK